MGAATSLYELSLPRLNFLLLVQCFTGSKSNNRIFTIGIPLRYIDGLPVSLFPVSLSPHGYLYPRFQWCVCVYAITRGGQRMDRLTDEQTDGLTGWDGMDKDTMCELVWSHACVRGRGDVFPFLSFGM